MQQDALLLDDLLQSQRPSQLLRGLALDLGREDVPELLQFIEELLHVASIVALAEALGPPLPRLHNGVLVVLGQTRVYQVCTNEYRCATLPGVAMHEHLASLLDHKLHDLDYVEELIELVVRQVLPVAVEVRDLAVHQQLGSVRKARLGNDAIAAERVLSRLLQVKHSCNALPSRR